MPPCDHAPCDQALGDKFSERALGNVLDHAPTLAESAAAAASASHHAKLTHAAAAAAAKAQRATTGGGGGHGGVSLFGVTVLGGLVRTCAPPNIQNFFFSNSFFKMYNHRKSCSAVPETTIQSFHRFAYELLFGEAVYCAFPLRVQGGARPKRQGDCGRRRSCAVGA
jgi:hypothetical protein